MNDLNKGGGEYKYNLKATVVVKQNYYIIKSKNRLKYVLISSEKASQYKYFYNSFISI